MNIRPLLSPLLIAALLASPLALAQNVDAAAQARADQAEAARSTTTAMEVAEAARVRQVEKARQARRLEQAKKQADKARQADKSADQTGPVEPEEEDDR